MALLPNLILYILSTKPHRSARRHQQPLPQPPISKTKFSRPTRRKITIFQTNSSLLSPARLLFSTNPFFYPGKFLLAGVHKAQIGVSARTRRVRRHRSGHCTCSCFFISDGVCVCSTALFGETSETFFFLLTYWALSVIWNDHTPGRRTWDGKLFGGEERVTLCVDGGFLFLFCSFFLF